MHTTASSELCTIISPPKRIRRGEGKLHLESLRCVAMCHEELPDRIMSETDPPVPTSGLAAASASHLETAISDANLRKHLITQLLETMWRPSELQDDEAERKIKASISALAALKPQDEAEGMLGVQMIATHHAALGCLKLALFDAHGRDRSLVHASKLLRIYVEQLQTLDRRRGGGGQRVNVGTVNVEPGAQAIVGNVSTDRSSR